MKLTYSAFKNLLIQSFEDKLCKLNQFFLEISAQDIKIKQLQAY